jgi:hypothetical protein
VGAKRSGDGGGLISEADLFKLLRVSDDAVLIGGQALAFWVAYFRLPIPPGPRTYVSHDADFLGFSRHVERFSTAIGGRAVYPPRHQITALEGVVMVKTAAGEKIGVDVLRSVVGLETDAVRKKAVQISDPEDPSLTFKVMHPIDCMVSRFENLRTLSEKRNEIGVWQARISIDVCRAYIEVLIAAGDEREAIRAATGVLEAAGATPGLQAFRKYGLDLLDGIPMERFTSISFKTQQYARTAARIRMLREAFQPPPTR